MKNSKIKPFSFWLGISFLSLIGFLFTIRLLPQNESSEVETFFFQILRQFENPTLTKMMIDISALGSFTVLILFTIAALIPLLQTQQKLSALFIFLNSSTALLLPHYLKSIFQRARPDIDHHLIEISTLSFPSGHALGSASIYFGFAYIIAKHTQQHQRSILPLTLISLLVIGICMTRIYLGVHYFYDVVGGLLAGIAWTSAIIGLFFHRPKGYERTSSIN